MYADLYQRRIPSSEYSVNINNFDLNSPEVPNPALIQYTLTSQLYVDYEGTIMSMSDLRTTLADDTAKYNEIVSRATGYKIGKSQDNNTSGIIPSPTMIEFSSANDFQIVFGTSASYETLPGGSLSTDKFKVMIPESDFGKTSPEFYIYVKADPVDSSLNDIQTLLYGSKNVVITASWTGTLAERNTSSIDYDFYNYVITGSGSGKLDIMWDPNWFDVNEFFFNSNLSGVTFENGNYRPTPIDGGTYDGWNMVTIIVDSSTGESRYDAANYISCALQSD